MDLLFLQQDVSNISVSDSPSHEQIRPPLGREQQDPSQSSPQQEYGKSGGEPEESVHAESAISPALLLDCGFAFPNLSWI